MEKVSVSARQRRERILDAAEALLLRVGLRGATMEAMAREARVAKPTLYGYFPDKAAVFAGVVGRLFARLRQVVEAALAGEGGATERAVRALSAKHAYVFRLLEGSPHAEELYAAPQRVSGEDLAVLDAWLVDEMTRAFVAEGHEDAARIAKILFDAADGIARHATGADEIEPAIGFLAKRLVGPPKDKG